MYLYMTVVTIAIRSMLVNEIFRSDWAGVTFNYFQCRNKMYCTYPNTFPCHLMCCNFAYPKFSPSLFQGGRSSWRPVLVRRSRLIFHLFREILLAINVFCLMVYPAWYTRDVRAVIVLVSNALAYRQSAVGWSPIECALMRTEGKKIFSKVGKV